MVRRVLRLRAQLVVLLVLVLARAGSADGHVGAHGQDAPPTAEAVAAAAREPTPLLRGKAFYEAGAMERARPELDAVLLAAPQDTVALRYRAMVHAHERRFKRAFADFDAALASARRPADREAALYYSGDAYFQAGIYDKAVARFEALLVEAPNHVDARCYLGEVRFKQGRKVQAAEAFRAAIRVDAKSAWAQHSLADVLAQLNQPDEAVRAYRADLALVPHCQTARANLAKVLEGTGRLDEALRELYTSLAYHPGDARAHAAMGRILLAKNEPLRAYAEYARALDFAPRDDEATGGLRAAKVRVEAAVGAIATSRELVFWRFIGWWLPALVVAGAFMLRARRGRPRA